MHVLVSYLKFMIILNILQFIHPLSFKKWKIIFDWKVYGYEMTPRGEQSDTGAVATDRRRSNRTFPVTYRLSRGRRSDGESSSDAGAVLPNRPISIWRYFVSFCRCFSRFVFCWQNDSFHLVIKKQNISKRRRFELGFLRSTLSDALSQYLSLSPKSVDCDQQLTVAWQAHHSRVTTRPATALMEPSKLAKLVMRWTWYLAIFVRF